MGKPSRDKGKRGEREAAAEIERLFGVPARRGQQFSGSPDSPDVVAGLPEVHIEVKRSEVFSAYKALAQAELDSHAEYPLVIHRKNGKQWIAVCYLDDLPFLATAIYLTMVENNGKKNDC